MRLDLTAEELKPLAGMSELRVLRISPINDEGLELIGRLSRLEFLQIYDSCQSPMPA